MRVSALVLVPPRFDVTISGVAGGTAGSGAPTKVIVESPPPVLVKLLPAPPAAGSGLYIQTPVGLAGSSGLQGAVFNWQAYGFSFRTTCGLDTLDVAVMSRRCLPVRYSAVVIVTMSGSGLI